MPYHHIEQIHERKGEKVALMLTAENMAGLVVGALPLYLLTSDLPFWLRAVILLLGGLLGVIATLEIGGLTPAARFTWLIRGLLRMRLHGARIIPEQLPGAAPIRRPARALRARGPIQVAPARGLAANRMAATESSTIPVTRHVHEASNADHSTW